MPALTEQGYDGIQETGSTGLASCKSGGSGSSRLAAAEAAVPDLVLQPLHGFVRPWLEALQQQCIAGVDALQCSEQASQNVLYNSTLLGNLELSLHSYSAFDATSWPPASDHVRLLTWWLPGRLSSSTTHCLASKVSRSLSTFCTLLSNKHFHTAWHQPFPQLFATSLGLMLCRQCHSLTTGR
jgi:hypothetical protein